MEQTILYVTNVLTFCFFRDGSVHMNRLLLSYFELEGRRIEPPASREEDKTPSYEDSR